MDNLKVARRYNAKSGTVATKVAFGGVESTTKLTGVPPPTSIVKGAPIPPGILRGNRRFAK